jgi:hypothetical protein
MNTSHQIEPTATARLLTCLGLAIDETKLIRSINQSSEVIRQLEADDPGAHRLIFLRRELSSLEARLGKIRRHASRIKIVIHLDKFR